MGKSLTNGLGMVILCPCRFLLCLTMENEMEQIYCVLTGYFIAGLIPCLSAWFILKDIDIVFDVLRIWRWISIAVIIIIVPVYFEYVNLPIEPIEAKTITTTIAVDNNIQVCHVFRAFIVLREKTHAEYISVNINGIKLMITRHSSFFGIIEEFKSKLKHAKQ